jgi:hypothetical protein
MSGPAITDSPFCDDPALSAVFATDRSLLDHKPRFRDMDDER